MQPLDSNQVTIEDAARVMAEFVWRFARRARSNDLLTLLGDTDVSSDGRPWDPASWYDWLASVDWIRAGHQPLSGSDLTGSWWAAETREFDPSRRRDRAQVPAGLSLTDAFLAMTEYLWRFANRPANNEVDDVLRVFLALDAEGAGRSFWTDWREAVDWILEGNPPQTGPAEG